MALCLTGAPVSAALAASSSPDDAANRLPPRFALLIGIDNYNKGWPRKQNAVRDAKLVASEFLRHGYKVAVLENPDSKRLARALKQFFLVDGDDPRAQLFVWYSGHAHTIDGRTFLVPSDAPLPRREGEFTNLSVALDDYTDLLRRAPAAQVYTVIDAPVAAIDFDTRPDPGGTRDPFAVDLPVRQFLASAAVGQAPGDDGVFRRLFLRGLAGINRADGNLDKMLTADEIGSYMVNRVAALTRNRQTPLYGRLPGREYAGGDYAFRIGISHRTDMTAARAHDPNGDAEEIERVLWSSIQDSTDPRKFESFLKIYPDGANAEKAFARLTLVRRAQDSTVASLSAPNAPSLNVPVLLPESQRARTAARSSQSRFAPAPPAIPVPLVASSTLPAPEGSRRTGTQTAQAGPAVPAFEEMAVPAKEAAQSPKDGRTNPLVLTPRNLDTGPAPTPIRGAQPASAFHVAPRTAIQPPAQAVPQPTPASVPKAAPTARAVPSPVPEAVQPLGGRMVQLGAYRSRAEAERALAASRRDVPQLFGDTAAPSIVMADLGEKGTYYRIRIGGFADSRRAGDFCAAYRGPGRDCFVVP